MGLVQSQALQVFREVARQGSITAAARALAYTQSAVSRQIAALEEDVGATLFDRAARGVRLTEAGRCLLGHADAVLDRWETARRDLAALAGLRAGRVRIGAFSTAMAALVPRAIAAFQARHEGVAVHVVEGLTPRLLDRLADGDADVAVVSAPPDQPLDTTRYQLHHLLDERLLVAVPRGHRLARRRQVRAAELAGESFIAGSADAEQTLLRATLPAGWTPRVDIVVREWTGKLGCVAAGLGIALVPRLGRSRLPANTRAVRVTDPVPEREILAVWRRIQDRSPAIRELVSHLRG
jgi:DNA-binding transcriptional LysR family regulator